MLRRGTLIATHTHTHRTTQDFFAPRYQYPTKDIWEYKPRYLDLLAEQQRVTPASLAEFRAELAPASADAGPEPSTAGQKGWWQSLQGAFGFSSSSSAVPASTTPSSTPAAKPREWDTLLHAGLQPGAPAPTAA